MCALIYLLYERLKGEILKKKKNRNRDKEDGERQLQKRSMYLSYLLCGDEIEMRYFIFF